MGNLFWCRALLPQEIDFARQHFGASLDVQLPSVQLYLRRIGDTRRPLSLGRGFISMPRACFAQADPRQPLLLTHPQVAGWFAHELLHQWQRARGVAVTRQAVWLQLRHLLGGRSPYAYARCSDAEAMRDCFANAQVEQQGQIWEDHVRACVAGQPASEFVLLAAEVRAGGEKARARA